MGLAALPIAPAQVARVIALVASGALNNKLARQVVDGVLAGEGESDEVVAARGLAVVSDDGALIAAAVDEPSQRSRTSLRRSAPEAAGRGAIVGAVMNATGGKVDAKRVRELIIARCANR